MGVYLAERLTCDAGQQVDLFGETHFFIVATCRASVHAIPEIIEVTEEAG